MAAHQSSQEISFYQLDAESSEIICGETRTTLRPKAFAVLQHLMAHRGHWVSRQELLDIGWGGHASSNVLSVTMREIRQALADTDQGENNKSSSPNPAKAIVFRRARDWRRSPRCSVSWDARQNRHS